MKRVLRDQGHIRRRGVVIRVKKSRRIGKMGILCSDLLRLGIHHICKTINASCDVQRQCHSAVITRRKQKPVQDILQHHLLTGDGIDRHRAFFQVTAFLRKCHDLVQTAVFQHYDRCQDLSCGCGEQLFIRVLFKDQSPCVGLHQHDPFPRQFRSIRPDLLLLSECRTA